MRFLIYLFSIAAILIVSCNNHDTPELKGKTPNHIADTGLAADGENIFPNETIALINNTGFSKYAKSQLPELDWTKFTMTRFWKEDFQVKSTFAPEKNYFDLYGKFLKYSPDSSMFIDLDSYNLEIHREKTGRLVGNSMGPDTEVSLIDLHKKQRTRLVFLGPGNSIEDAVWIDNNNFLLIGLEENPDAKTINAIIWKYDLHAKMVYAYELKDEELVKKTRNYAYKERLKDLIIR